MSRLSRKNATRALLALGLLALGGCGIGSGLREYTRAGEALGTEFHVNVALPEPSPAQTNKIDWIIERELWAVDARMSTYREDSELSALNRAAGDTPIRVSPELLRVLLAARRVGEQTRGAFDITVGPLVDAWGFGPGGHRGTIPAPAKLAALRKVTGWNRIKIDERNSTVTKASEAVHCDLSGIAKGYAVDRVAEALSAAGFGNHSVEIGGEVRASGQRPAGGDWRVGIARPRAAGAAVLRVVPLHNSALATSGDYRNFFEIAGVRYTHIIDPRTARPERHRAGSVTVVGPDCMTADALATGLTVLGEDEGYDVAVRNHLAVLFLLRKADGGVIQKATPRFEALFGKPD